VKLRSSKRNDEDGTMKGNSLKCTRPLVGNDVELEPPKKRNQMNMASKFRFDNITTGVGYPEFKEALRAKGIVPGLCVITVRGGSAVVAFKEETTEVWEKLRDLEIRKSRIKIGEVSLKDEAKLNVKNDLEEKRKQVEKIRSKVLQDVLDNLRLQNLTGVFISKLPVGVTEADIMIALEARNQVPINIEIGHRSRHAVAFFNEELHALLIILKHLIINGKECQVEEYKHKKDEKNSLEASLPLQSVLNAK
jgi:hypothetical protein